MTGSHRFEPLCSGSALIVVLWSVVVLSTISYSSLRGTRLDLRVAKNFGDRVQARYLALGGIEYAKAFIHDTRQREYSSGERYSEELYDNPSRFERVELGRGSFRVIRGRTPAEGYGEPLLFGVLDAERFLDLNRASVAELRKLPDMDPDVAASIVDWRDPDPKVSDGGAEAEYYHNLRPPSLIRNSPIETIREVLMIKGVDPATAFGEDADGDRLLDDNERDGERRSPRDNGDSRLDGGWTQWVTLESSVPNLDRFGEERLELSNVTIDDLALIEGLDDATAEAIVAWRDNRSLETVADLLDVKALQENPNANNNANNNGNNNGNRNDGGNSNGGNNRGAGDPAPNSGNNNNNNNGDAMQPVGDSLIDADLLASIGDHFTASAALARENVININTCSLEVLSCLTGMTEDLAQAILDERQIRTAFRSTAELLEVEGMDQAKFKQLAPRLDVRSGTFLITAEGAVPGTGARQTIQVTVRFGDFDVETLSYREAL
ncbi:MAG: helix-hairpin-helix domain-containing protein [Planctomycetota bacterium]